ncbi:MAG: HNH endonuclease family protein [Candidatus Saccharibacteria bacterium]|nr:HNH endonuclease family protein [Candidatus Saccharibacteria bacterium]
MKLKVRRLSVVGVILALVVIWLAVNPASYDAVYEASGNDGTDYVAEAVSKPNADVPLATEVLGKLEAKGRAPKTGYTREEFYNGWPTIDGCSLRQRIIKREFGDLAVLDGCRVVAGEYEEPYTGEHRKFNTKEEVSKLQIDHVVALSDAWQKGAQNLDKSVRYQIATDPLNLLAVDGSANQQKSDGDAATWLPPNKRFRCQYIARQISVKYKYGLWVTEAEREAMAKVLQNCPQEPAIGV